jgi:hypothetical protein
LSLLSILSMDHTESISTIAILSCCSGYILVLYSIVAVDIFLCYTLLLQWIYSCLWSCYLSVAAI